MFEQDPTGGPDQAFGLPDAGEDSTEGPAAEPTKQLKTIVESLLFASGAPVSVQNLLGVLHDIATGKGGILGRTIAVDQAALLHRAQEVFDMRHREHIAAGQHLPYRGQALALLFHHLMEQAGGEP